MTTTANTCEWNAEPRRRAGASFVAILALPWTWAQRWHERRELMGLLGEPEGVLKDVGLQRDAITREGLKPFWDA